MDKLIFEGKINNVAIEYDIISDQIFFLNENWVNIFEQKDLIDVKIRCNNQYCDKDVFQTHILLNEIVELNLDIKSMIG